MKNRHLPVVCSLALVAAAAVFVACGGLGGWRAVDIADVSEPADFTVHSSAWDFYHAGHPTGVTVWVTGEITGEAEVWADGWPPQRLTGRVDWRNQQDWFYDRCPLHYKPLGPVSGHLTIRYLFE